MDISDELSKGRATFINFRKRLIRDLTEGDPLHANSLFEQSDQEYNDFEQSTLESNHAYPVFTEEPEVQTPILTSIK